MQLDNVSRLGIETDHIDAPGEGLQVCVFPRRFPEAVHHIEGIFVAVKIEGLKPCTPACLEVLYPRIGCGFNSR
jgi:hypothetical protein